MQQGRASEKESIVKGFEISKEMMQSTTLAEAQKEQIKEQMSFLVKSPPTETVILIFILW